MPRVLVAGCGYLGEATADLFHQKGWEVEGWARSANTVRQFAAKPYPVLEADISNARTMEKRRTPFDVIIQCASTRGGRPNDYRQVYVEGARNLLRAFTGAVLVFTSSSSVYAQSDGSWVTEENAAEPTHEIGQIMREAEELVLSHGGIVTRVAGIYGPGRSHLLKTFLNGQASFDPARDRFINQAHRDDVALALSTVVETRKQGRATGLRDIFNIVDDQPILQSDCYKWLSDHFGRPMPSIISSSAPRRRGESNKRVSNQKLHALGWRPRYPTFAKAMCESILPSWETLEEQK